MRVYSLYNHLKFTIFYKAQEDCFRRSSLSSWHQGASAGIEEAFWKDSCQGVVRPP
jgi:NADH:ubiquinone oxidoreductase subunit D